ncbi:MAG: N-acetylmuramoyl-L-alanine amidase [Parvibaculum sp.]|nr:N-acetylmuramoyl-L-alanine amidase [Parvibaculum sp.]
MAAVLLCASFAVPGPAHAENGFLAVPVSRPKPVEVTPASPAPVTPLSGMQVVELDQALGARELSATPRPVAPVAGSAAVSGPRANIAGIRLGDRGAETRFVIEMSGPQPVKYQVFTLAQPYRIVIDFHNMNSSLPDVAGVKGQGLVASYRYGVFQENTFRVVIDTNGPVKLSRDFTLDPQSGFGRRVVLDVASTDLGSFMSALSVPSATQPAAVPATVVPPNPEIKRASRRVIVIDAGHGGVDPGTHGKSGVLEKDVVLAFAKELRRRLKDTGRYDVYLTRDRDIFIPLRERVAIARRHKADLFISVHADSIASSTVSGMSIYTLSETASDKEAAALARKENLSDAIAGIDFRGESPEVAGILIDLAQRETKNYSSRFAKSVVDYSRTTTSMLDPAHRFAGFVVLKAPDVPSVLIELGFLTNRADEKNITSPKWRTKVASSFVTAIDRYFGERRAENGN